MQRRKMHCLLERCEHVGRQLLMLTQIRAAMHDAMADRNRLGHAGTFKRSHSSCKRVLKCLSV